MKKTFLLFATLLCVTFLYAQFEGFMVPDPAPQPVKQPEKN
jgi:hypothetical protein